MHYSNTATSIHASGCVRREPVVDLTAVMWVSCSAYATHFPSFPPSAPMYGPVLRKCLHLKDSPIPQLAPRTPARHALEDVLPLLPNLLLILAHMTLHVSTSVLYTSLIRRELGFLNRA